MTTPIKLELKTKNESDKTLKSKWFDPNYTRVNDNNHNSTNAKRYDNTKPPRNDYNLNDDRRRYKNNRPRHDAHSRENKNDTRERVNANKKENPKKSFEMDKDNFPTLSTNDKIQSTRTSRGPWGQPLPQSVLDAPPKEQIFLKVDSLDKSTSLRSLYSSTSTTTRSSQEQSSEFKEQSFDFLKVDKKIINSTTKSTIKSTISNNNFAYLNNKINVCRYNELSNNEEMNVLIENDDVTIDEIDVDAYQINNEEIIGGEEIINEEKIIGGEEIYCEKKRWVDLLDDDE